ncbi:hypothetical protein H0E87_030107 [Populus deltoides]|uniref:Rieske domain-containing protein n=1 Tax=Populus deltoides TaxID=3696 RepID=A0A8T2WNH3_POPDE|nr:hypothetical protein H0E87_030107 [Populus deltoides]
MALSLHLSLSHKNFSNPFASFSPTTKLPTTIHINSHLLKSIHSKPYYIKKCHAVADAPTAIPPSLDAEDDAHGVLIGPSSEEERRGDGAVVDYNWTEEWYPLYLTKDVPDDAPLGLNVFDKQLVLYKDGQGELRCHEDRCPHRLAKLSEGQLIDGRLECLYHGWQFEGEGKCVKIPQLPANAKIPQSACVKTYEVKESQGVVWLWMSLKTPPNFKKVPWFENFARPGFQDTSTIHELPYDHSILLENLMDPAHIPISHDRTDWTAKREDAQALRFEVTERTHRGFAGRWGKEKDQKLLSFLRFQAPCVLSNDIEFADEKGVTQYFTGLFLCRPTGQGKSMIIVRFGATKRPQMAKLNTGNGWTKLDMECLIILATTPFLLPEVPAVVEHAPAGLVAGVSASSPAKGGIGTMHAPNVNNRYFRHVIHCKGCTSVVKNFQAWKNALSAISVALTALAILASGRQWKTFLLVSASLCLAGVYACSTAIAMNTTNFIRTHRRL